MQNAVAGAEINDPPPQKLYPQGFGAAPHRLAACAGVGVKVRAVGAALAGCGVAVTRTVGTGGTVAWLVGGPIVGNRTEVGTGLASVAIVARGEDVTDIDALELAELAVVGLDDARADVLVDAADLVGATLGAVVELPLGGVAVVRAAD